MPPWRRGFSTGKRQAEGLPSQLNKGIYIYTYLSIYINDIHIICIYIYTCVYIYMCMYSCICVYVDVTVAFYILLNW